MWYKFLEDYESYPDVYKKNESYQLPDDLAEDLLDAGIIEEDKDDFSPLDTINNNIDEMKQNFENMKNNLFEEDV